MNTVAADAIPLRKRTAARLTPLAPFHFEGTVYKPSHFPAPISAFRDGIYWQTMRLGDDLLGVRMEEAGSTHRPAIDVALYSASPLDQERTAAALAELSWRFDLAVDLSQFNRDFESDAVLGPVIDRWRGMRISASDSLYETLIIYITLQNATVRRTVQMTEALLSTYGTALEFDGQALYAFWKPKEMARVPDQALRDLKVGYRAVSILRNSEAFAVAPHLEVSLRGLPQDEARRRLLALYGVGPVTVDGLLFGFLHHFDALNYMPPWEGKILSRIIFGEERSPAETLEEITRRWEPWRALAAHYLFEDLFWRHSRTPIPWLQELIRL